MIKPKRSDDNESINVCNFVPCGSFHSILVLCVAAYFVKFGNVVKGMYKMKHKQTMKVAKERNECPICFDEGTIQCGAERGVRCGVCEELQRLDPSYKYGEVLPLEHICDDCAGLGTFKAYVYYCGKH